MSHFTGKATETREREPGAAPTFLSCSITDSRVNKEFNWQGSWNVTKDQADDVRWRNLLPILSCVLSLGGLRFSHQGQGRGPKEISELGRFLSASRGPDPLTWCGRRQASEEESCRQIKCPGARQSREGPRDSASPHVNR